MASQINSQLIKPTKVSIPAAANRTSCCAELAVSSPAAAEAMASIHCTYLRRDREAELVWMAWMNTVSTRRTRPLIGLAYWCDQHRNTHYAKPVTTDNQNGQKSQQDRLTNGSLFLSSLHLVATNRRRHFLLRAFDFVAGAVGCQLSPCVARGQDLWLVVVVAASCRYCALNRYFVRIVRFGPVSPAVGLLIPARGLMPFISRAADYNWDRTQSTIEQWTSRIRMHNVAKLRYTDNISPTM